MTGGVAGCEEEEEEEAGRGKCHSSKLERRGEAH